MSSIDKLVEDDVKISDKRFVESDIRKFYAGKTIFVTGSTGFVGKALVEKILRGCPDVRKIYLLVRDKKGQSAEERIKNYFDDDVFEVLRDTCSDFKSKIHLIVGDLEQEEMALSETDKNTIIDEVDIIFHNASIVKFNQRLSKTLTMNVFGTRSMLDLAKRCKRIEGFLYVSTAYSHCYKRDVMEEAYPPPADLRTVQDLVNDDLASPTGVSDETLKNILGKFPNAYSFSKATAEGLVDETGKQVPFPCIIHRPSAVLSAWKEPLRSWCGSRHGGALVALIYGRGIIHAALVKDVKVDIIPVDMLVNSILVSFRNSVQENRKGKFGAHVYNYGSSVENPITLKDLRDMCAPGEKIVNPSIHMMWTNFCIFTESRWYFEILHFAFHVLPAYMLDAYMLAVGKKPRGVPLLRKVTKDVSTLSFYVRGEWNIHMSVMNKAIDRMSQIDRELFSCDVRQLDWKDYCSTYWDGLRLYLLKDPVSTIPAARRKLRIIEAVHYTVKYAALLLIAYATVRFFNLLQIKNALHGTLRLFSDPRKSPHKREERHEISKLCRKEKKSLFSPGVKFDARAKQG